MNSRRDFLIGAAAPLLLAWPAQAAPLCAPEKAMKGTKVCRAYIDSMKASQETDQASRDPRAIWVACVAVVFAMYDHIVPQARIMTEGYGGLDKIPVDAGIAVALPLTRTWKDEEGVGFRASFEPLFDDGAAGGAFDAKPLFGAIANGDPLNSDRQRPRCRAAGARLCGRQAGPRGRWLRIGSEADGRPAAARSRRVGPQLSRRRAAACGAHEDREGVARGICARTPSGRRGHGRF